MIPPIAFLFTLFPFSILAADRPNLILVMADDMGWGQTRVQSFSEVGEEKVTCSRDL